MISDKYRPNSFSSVFGQDMIVRILRNSIKLNRIPTAVLLSGLYGSGKTSLARIYARSLNCSNFQDDCCNLCVSCLESLSGSNQNIWEFDSATRNGIEDIKEISSIVSHVPLYKKNVIILDEVHQLSKTAQSAFLKVLEEPPEDTIFILVTTDPDKLSDTIRSRCLNLRLRVPNVSDMLSNVKMILDNESVNYTDQFLLDLANNFNGSFRDVHKLLDQLILAFGNNLESNSLMSCFDIISIDQYKDLAHLFCDADLQESLKIIDEFFYSGVDLDLLFKVGVPNILRDFLLISSGYLPERTSSGLDKNKIKSNLDLTTSQIQGMLAAWERTYDKFSGIGSKSAWFMFLAMCRGDSDGGVD